MALIATKFEDKKDRVKLDLSSRLLADIHQYMEWANIDDMEYFIEECVKYTFSRDSEWKKHQKLSKSNKK